MQSLTPPVISLPDPLVDAEGSIDPLSLATTYERLADRILPAVTVRMRRVRFMTAMCLGAWVCRDQRDAVASDGVTPAWLVFEWFVIEAFARTDEDPIGQGIPGLLKVKSSLRSGRDVSAASYLKTPKVFGFTGIFRRLARHAHLLDDDLELDDGGFELLDAWARDQGLSGLLEGDGAGRDLVAELRDAVSRGMVAGHSVPARSGGFWQNIAQNLHPDHIGQRERLVLHARIRATHPLTAEHIDALAQHGQFVKREGEAAYLRKRVARSSPELARHLTAIDAYEGICRPIADAFDLVRELSTACGGGPVDANTFATAPGTAELVSALRKASVTAERHEALLMWNPEIRTLIDHFGQVDDARELFHAVIAHHEHAQRMKPPDGKRPWLERAQGDTFMVRPAYTIEPRSSTPPYVHDYRTATLCGFLSDLGVCR